MSSAPVFQKNRRLGKSNLRRNSNEASLDRGIIFIFLPTCQSLGRRDPNFSSAERTKSALDALNHLLHVVGLRMVAEMQLRKGSGSGWHCTPKS